jgi:hypothetical protein
MVGLHFLIEIPVPKNIPSSDEVVSTRKKSRKRPNIAVITKFEGRGLSQLAGRSGMMIFVTVPAIFSKECYHKVGE